MLKKLRLGWVLATVAWVTAAPAQDFDEVDIETIQITDTIYMMIGAGGNLGLCTGEQTTFLIDDQFAPLTLRILNAIGEITEHPVQFVLNTHWHGDHTGGNENLAKKGSVIVAHENVRKRMSTTHFNEVFGTTSEPSPPEALPQVTFTESVTFHLNGEEIYVVHPSPAHTDGDAIVYFKSSNVVHCGDIFFNGMYPFIDTSSGGTIEGVIEAAESIVESCNEETVVIPGHGPKSNRAELLEYIGMLRTVRDRTLKAIADGVPKTDFIPSQPFADLDEKWGQGFLPAPVFADIVYSDLSGAEIEQKVD